MINDKENKPSKEQLEDLYINKELSTREIAEELSITKGSAEHLLEQYGIPRRTYAQASAIKSTKYRKEKTEEAKIVLEETLKHIPYTNNKKIEPVKTAQILVPIFTDDNKDCTITLVLSDLHIGDANHLPDTYWSTVKNTGLVLSYLKKNMNVKSFNIVVNGDIVAGKDVFRLQELRNILQRGHWQVFMAEYIVRKTITELEEAVGIPLNKIYLTRGNHENLATNFILFLKRILGEKA
jgi:hypothetical protein